MSSPKITQYPNLKKFIAQFVITFLDYIILDYPLHSLDRDPVIVCRERLSWILEQHSLRGPVLVCVVCRRGNDSQLAVRKLKDKSDSLFGDVAVEIKDIVGGLTEWSNTIDETFPKY